MGSRLLAIILVLASICMLLPGFPALAAVSFAANAVADPSAAARAAAGMSGGRVLDVQTRNLGDRSVYDVKVLLENGRVRIIQVDGKRAPPASAEND